MLLGAANGDQGRNVEAKLHTRTGEERTLLVSWDGVTLGGERYIVATGTDLTEHLRAEDALRRSESQADQLREETAKSGGQTIAKVQRYEVAVAQELSGVTA